MCIGAGAAPCADAHTGVVMADALLNGTL